MIKFFVFIFAAISITYVSSAHGGDNNTNSILISEGTYNKLPNREQKKYVKEVRKNYYEFEAVLNKDTNFADSSSNKYQFVLSIFMNPAIAESTVGYCVLGGNDLELSKEGKCPIQENLCKNDPSKFQCSDIYASECVKVSPKEEISKRCYEASIGSTADYSALKERYDQVYNNVCKDFDNLKKLKQEHVAACHYLGLKLEKLSEALEAKLRADLNKCEEELAAVKLQNTNLQADLKLCQDQLPKAKDGAETDAENPQGSLDCVLSGSKINASNLEDIGNIQMFKKDSRMNFLLGGRGVESIHVTSENGKACFSFEVNERAAKRFEENKRLQKNSEFAQMVNGKIQGCTSNGVEFKKGKLFVPALLSRKYNFVTMQKDRNGRCQMGTDLLKKINGDFKGRGVSSVKE